MMFCTAMNNQILIFSHTKSHRHFSLLHLSSQTFLASKAPQSIAP
jgi:hypothetical protein